MFSSWIFFWDGNGNAPINTHSTVAVVLPEFADQSQWGARGHDYHPMPDEYWQGRALLIRPDPPKASIFDTPSAPRAPNPGAKAAVSALSAQRASLSDNLMNVASIDDLKAGAAQIQQIDSTIASLGRGRNEIA